MIINLQNVSKKFYSQTVLSDINMTIDQPKIVALLGPSGGGKTTLIKIMLGLLNTDQGMAQLWQHRVPHRPLLKDVGYMEQADALYLDLSAYDNMMYFANMYGLKGDAKIKAIRETLQFVQLDPDSKKPVQYFSGGMKRRLSLAVTLVHQPKLLILDEPTTGIDPRLKKLFWQKFQALKQQGVTIFLTTHLMEEAYMSDEVYFLQDGRILTHGHANQILQNSGCTNLEEAFIYYSQGDA